MSRFKSQDFCLLERYEPSSPPPNAATKLTDGESHHHVIADSVCASIIPSSLRTFAHILYLNRRERIFGATAMREIPSHDLLLATVDHAYQARPTYRRTCPDFRLVRLPDMTGLIGFHAAPLCFLPARKRRERIDLIIECNEDFRGLKPPVWLAGCAGAKAPAS